MGPGPFYLPRGLATFRGPVLQGKNGHCFLNITKNILGSQKRVRGTRDDHCLGASVCITRPWMGRRTSGRGALGNRLHTYL